MLTVIFGGHALRLVELATSKVIDHQGREVPLRFAIYSAQEMAVDAASPAMFS
jgi:hypothetical protein